MNRGRASACLGVVIAAALPVAAPCRDDAEPTFDLRSPAPKAGLKLKVTTKHVAKNATIEITKDGKKEEKLFLDQTQVVEEEVTVKEVDRRGVVTQLQTRITRDDMTMEAGPKGGKKEKTEEKGPLVGEVVDSV